jgi:toxin ParE1/3/4
VKRLLKVLRKPQYWESLQAIEDHTAQDNPVAAVDMWLAIDDQVSKLADPNFPRRPGRVPATLELVVHPNYVVILEQNLDTVTVLEVLHSGMRYP